MSKQTNESVFNMIPRNGAVSVLEIARWGLKPSAVKNALRQLLAKGFVARSWDGNQRFGRYLYRRVN